MAASLDSPVPTPPGREPTTSGRHAAAQRLSGESDSRDKQDPKRVGPWRIGKTIGTGSSGRVKIARHEVTRQYAAVKIVPKPRPTTTSPAAKTDKMLLGIEREIVIMKLVEHPNVLRLMDVWETGSELYLIMEYVEGGELFDYLVSKGRLHADEALHYFQQIISGVDYCHRYNICHRDLKPENLLLDAERNIKIADFGMAALERGGKLLETSCGSPHYASPEIVAGLNYHGASSDIWSCGIILFALLTGRLPFDDENIRTLLAKVKAGRFTMPSELPADAQDLIRKMLEIDPQQRITMKEIQAHPWMTRRPPRSIHGAPPYTLPSIDHIEHPVASYQEIDPDILNNLKTLWNGASEEAIVESLLSQEKTWEKVFYCLLLKYRTQNLENFNMEDEEVKKPRRVSDKNRQHVVATGAIASRSRRSRQSLSNIAAAAIVSKRTKAGSPPPVVRPVSVARPISTGRPLPVAPTQARPVSTPAHSPRVPVIHLQEASPSPILPLINAGRSMYDAYPAPPSPSPLGFDSSLPPVLPIQIPQPGDEAATQQFYRDVVNHLQTISQRNSSAPSSPAPTQLSFMGAAGLPFLNEDSTQFEDAEDDESETGTQISFNEAQYPEARKPLLQPLILNKPPPLVRPRIANRSSTREVVQPVGRVNSRASSSTSTYNSQENRRPVSYDYGGGPGNKENVRYSRGPPPIAPRPVSMGKEKRATLGLAIQEAGVPNFEGDGRRSVSPALASLKMKKKKVAFSPASVSTSESTGPKQSWFAGLFNWKQLSYTLMSTDNAHATRLACKKVMEAMGVIIVVENADGLAILKCKVTELRDGTGSSGPLKAVKFRVEFSSHSPISPTMSNSPREQYPTCVTLIMEKGAHSTFKLAYNRVRSAWELDTPRYTNGLGAVRLVPSPMPSPIIGNRRASPIF